MGSVSPSLLLLKCWAGRKKATARHSAAGFFLSDFKAAQNCRTLESCGSYLHYTTMTNQTHTAICNDVPTNNSPLPSTARNYSHRLAYLETEIALLGKTPYLPQFYETMIDLQTSNSLYFGHLFVTVTLDKTSLSDLIPNYSWCSLGILVKTAELQTTLGLLLVTFDQSIISCSS